MNILVKFPTRNRPHIFLRRLSELASLSNNIQVLVSYDEDDSTMTPKIVKQAMDMISPIVIIQGEGSTKIEACNRDVSRIKDWDIIVLMSDDMVCQVENWDEVVRYDMRTNFPDTDGCLWYSDGYQDRICTMVVMGKTYYDNLGYLYHPDYTSLWSDNEMTEQAQYFGKLYKSNTCLFRHEHPMNNRSIQNDALYKRNEPFYEIDKQVYDRRKENRFQ